MTLADININTVLTLGGVLISSYLVWKGNKSDFKIVHSAILNVDEGWKKEIKHQLEYIQSLKERYTDEIHSIKTNVKELDNIVYDELKPKLIEHRGAIDKNCVAVQEINKRCIIHQQGAD